MIGEVYRVRTSWRNKSAHHCAEKGTLVVITGRYPDGLYRGLAQGFYSGEQFGMEFRPCDLQKLPFHEEVNGEPTYTVPTD